MFQGSFVALITPFSNGVLDEPALRRLVKWHLQNGTHGLVPMGTTGEASTVTEQEHRRVVEIVVEECNGRLPVIAGVGSNNPNESIGYAKYAQSVGADGVLCVAGYYNRPSQEGLYQHFLTLHEATDIPIMVYNIPPRTIVDIEVTTMARLAELPRIIGVKDATRDLGRICVERNAIRKPFDFFSGDDITALAYNANGGTGCISVTANVLARPCADLQTATLNDDFKKALALHDSLTPVHMALSAEPNPAGIKYAASLFELCSEECRLPMVPLSEGTRLRIRQALAPFM